MADLSTLKCRCGRAIALTQVAASGRRVCACLRSWMPSDDPKYVAPVAQTPPAAPAPATPSQNPPPAAPASPTPLSGPPPAPAQITNPATVLPTLPGTPGKDLRNAALKWRRDNPEAYAVYDRLALRFHAEGMERIGIGWLTEKVRFEYSVQTKGEFKISNDIRAYIARMLVQDHPELTPIFVFRETRC